MLFTELHPHHRSQAFFREVMLWQDLRHNHITPFLGIDTTVFELAPCLVIPWMEHGNVMEYVRNLVQKNGLSGSGYVVTLNRLVRV